MWWTATVPPNSGRRNTATATLQSTRHTFSGKFRWIWRVSSANAQDITRNWCAYCPTNNIRESTIGLIVLHNLIKCIVLRETAVVYHQTPMTRRDLSHHHIVFLWPFLSFCVLPSFLNVRDCRFVGCCSQLLNTILWQWFHIHTKHESSSKWFSWHSVLLSFQSEVWGYLVKGC